MGSRAAGVAQLQQDNMMTKMDLEGEEKAGSGVGTFVKKSVQMGISTTKTRLGKVAATTQETALEVAETTKKVLYNVFSTLLTALLVVSASLFMYGAFYYAYMPKEVHEVDDTSDHGDEEENNAEDDVGNDQIGEIDQ